LFTGRQQSIDSQGDCRRMKLEHSGMQSDSRFSRRADKDSTIVTEDHRHARRKKSKAEKLVEFDKERTKELYELKSDIEKFELRMRKDRRRRRMHELSMEKAKEKWPVKELMVMRQRRMLKGWLRYAENLKAIEEEVIYVCKPETGRGLDDWEDEEDELGSSEDLKHCQEGREEEIPVFQEGNEMRSLRDLRDCHEESHGISHCQLGNERRSLRDLEVYQEGSGSIPYCQVGRDEKMRLSEGLINSEVSWNQPEELIEQMRLSEGLINSGMEVDQHVHLTEVKDQDDILMIGGIGVFLPCAQEEAEICVADAATAEQSQLTMTVRKEEELEQTLEAAQTEEEEEHSEECLNIFSQEAEEAIALRLTAEEGKENEHSEEWLNIFSQEAEKTATGEVAEIEEEGADSICFADLWEKIESLEERVKVQSVHIQ
jgi:hypothetical protein